MLSCSWLMKFLRQITRLFASFLAFIFNRIWSVSNVQSIWNVSSEGFAAVWSMLRMIIMIFLSNSNQSWNITINYFKKLPDLFDWLHYEWMNSKAALSISSLESWNDNSHKSAASLSIIATFHQPLLLARLDFVADRFSRLRVRFTRSHNFRNWFRKKTNKK